jgi:hypothetical protein
MINRGRNSHGSTPGLPSPTATKSRTGKPLDRTQLWVAAIGAGGAIIAAIIAGVSAFAAGWLHYSGPGATAQQSHSSTGTGDVTATASESPPMSPTSQIASPIGNTTTLYLADQTGTTSDIYASPESGKWALSGTTYNQSVGYPQLCTSGDVTYTLDGTYKYFIATVGVADDANSGDQSTTVNFEVDDGSGNVLGSKVAQYGKPQVIKVSVQGISSLTLQTSIADGGCFSSPSVAIRGNASVVG